LTLRYYTCSIAQMKALLRKIDLIECERKKLITELLNTTQMVRGTFAINYRRCGKTTCWCYESEKGHPHNRITWTRNGKSKSKVIPKKDVAWTKKMAANYKNFRKKRQRLRDINEQLRSLLNKLEDEITEKTNMQKS